MSSMGGLYIGMSGLRVSQSALNTTAHNLANVDTKGFVRQQLVLSDTRYNNMGYTHFNTLQKGLGSTIMSVRQVRDVFLDQAYRREVGRQSFYEAGSQAVEEIEGLFGELEGVPFQDTLKDFWGALQEIGKEPDSIVARALLVENSITLIERAEKISKQMEDYQNNLNVKILDQVNRINSIGDQIKELNTKIRLYESNGMENANDLRDMRNLLLDELGQMVNITYKEQVNGTVDVSVEGIQFVADETVYHMGTARVNDKSPMLKPIWPKSGGRDVFNLDNKPSSAHNTDIGSLKGLLFARGDRKANYTDIPVREDYDTEQAFENATREYNNKIDTSAMLTAMAGFDQLIHGLVTKINDILSPNKEVTLADGSKIKILDVEKAPVGMGEHDTPGEALFNRKSVDRYKEEEITIRHEDGTTETFMAKVYNEEDKSDPSSLFTLGEIVVNPEIIANYSKLPLSSNSGSGEFDVKVAEELLKVWQEPFATISPNTLTMNNFSDYYTALIGGLANKGEQYNNISSHQASMVNSIENQRLGVTSVSSAEELTSLIQFQHSYNAASRYVNVVSEMLEHIIMRMA